MLLGLDGQFLDTGEAVESLGTVVPHLSGRGGRQNTREGIEAIHAVIPDIPGFSHRDSYPIFYGTTIKDLRGSPIKRGSTRKANAQRGYLADA